MRRSFLMIAGTVLALGATAFAVEGKRGAVKSQFALAAIRFEQNATDGDVEVVFEVIGRNEGVKELKITAPDGRTVVDFRAPITATAKGAQPGPMGMRQFTFESPEPTDVAALKAAYPAGEYLFAGTTISGLQLESKVKLSHELPATTSLISPKAKAKDVPLTNVKITWSPVKDVTGYKLELSNEDSGANIEAQLPATATSFSIPEGFLVSGESYQLGIGTISAAGNISYVETEFDVADGK